MTDVLLINPPTPQKGRYIIRDLNRSGRTSKERIIWPQTSLAYLAAMLPKKISVKIVDCIAEDMDWEKLEAIIGKEKPKLVGAHVITSTAHNDLKTFGIVKRLNKKTKTVTFGPHSTELVSETFSECEGLDYIIRGEPELTFEALVKHAFGEKISLSSVDGLAYRAGGKIRINKDRKFIKDLDSLPLPRHDLLPIKKYLFPFMSEGFTFVVGSRGCPFPCTFCRQPIMWKGQIRSRSPESLIEEMKLLRRLGIKEFLFSTDTFTVDKQIVMKFCELMIREGLNDIRWACNSRVDTIDREMAEAMKKAGCWMMALGLESGSNKILKLAKKGTTVKQNKEIVKMLDDVGIKIYGYFIIGLLGETKKTIRQTIELAKELPVTFAIFHVASPYPGTVFYKQVKERGFLTDEGWEASDQGNMSPVDYPDLSGSEIIAGIRRAYREFYLRPIAVWRILTSVRNFGDLGHLVSAGLSQLFWR